MGIISAGLLVRPIYLPYLFIYLFVHWLTYLPINFRLLISLSINFKLYCHV
jgi:hypothetical protein